MTARQAQLAAVGGEARRDAGTAQGCDLALLVVVEQLAEQGAPRLDDHVRVMARHDAERLTSPVGGVLKDFGGHAHVCGESVLRVRPGHVHADRCSVIECVDRAGDAVALSREVRATDEQAR